MSRKRRIFDIEMPTETPEVSDVIPESASAPKEDTHASRRGPMATAIGETAESLRERREIEARIRAENDALAHEHVRLKRLGLVLDLVPLDAVLFNKLTRDRAKGEDDELTELVASIRDIGLSNPIRVEDAGDGQYELIQGFRRLSAFRALHEKTGDECWARIPAAISQPGDGLDDLYRRMVDENLIRKDISFAEMAQLAIDFASDPETAESDPDKAVALLFKSAGYQKRSYIRTFIKVLRAIGPHLKFAQDMPRSLGLALAARMEQMDGLGGAVRDALSEIPDRNSEDELNVLRRLAGNDVAPVLKTSRKSPADGGSIRKGQAKTSFQFDRAEGRVKCTASDGRLELRAPRDFSTTDRRKLEDAVRRMLDQLD